MSAATRLTTLLSVHDIIAIFNCFVLDFHSFLWKGSPLPSSDPELRKARHELIRYAFTDLPPRIVGEIAQGRVACSLGLIHCIWSCVCSICFGLYENAQTRPQHFVANSRSSTSYFGIFKGTRIECIYTFPTTFVGSLADSEARKRGHHY